MKRFMAILTILAVLTAVCPVWAEEAVPVKYETLVAGTPMQFSGNFFSGALGNNISDLDVRRLIHGYSPVVWSGDAGAYLFDDSVVTGRRVSVDSAGNRTYSIVLADDLFYNDGTPVTAWDYAFSVLLETSRILETAAGSRKDGSSIVGFADYDSGRTETLSGFRVYGDKQFSVTISADYTPYFYELQLLDMTPCPISLIAPGCSVTDDGNGIRIDGDGFDASGLRETLLNADTGYMSHPAVTCGPYMLTDYDGTTASMSRNPYYKGNLAGRLPSVEKIRYTVVDEDTMLQDLTAGKLDLVVRCTRQDNIMGGMQLIGSGEFSMANYSRSGLSFIRFCGEKGPAGRLNVRKAVALCMDKEQLIRQYVGGFGMAVNGYYGIGQWMYLMANGTMKPDNGTENGWETVNLDGLTVYAQNTEEAIRLLEEDGWTLNAQGEPFNAETDDIRCRTENGELIPLELKLLCPAGNTLPAMMDNCFINHLKEAGIGLATETVPMTELLEYYYGSRARDCDMILLGTNFADVFDPSADFSADGTDRSSGLRDERMARYAVDLRQTEPGDTLTYVKKWIAFQEYRTSVAYEIPLYSNAYFDFFTSALQDYNPALTGNWTGAVLNARFGDFEEAATPFN